MNSLSFLRTLGQETMRSLAAAAHTQEHEWSSECAYGYTESWDTEIRFYQNGDFSRGGSGEERDWDYRGKCYSSRFDWKVRNGRIYLYYDDGYNIVIDRYDLYWRSNTQRFRGYFEDFDTGDQLASFDLVKVVDWHDFSKKSQDNGLFNEEKKEWGLLPHLNKKNINIWLLFCSVRFFH